MTAIEVNIRRTSTVRRARDAVSSSGCLANVRAPQEELARKNRRTRSRNTTARPAIGASSSHR